MKKGELRIKYKLLRKPLSAETVAQMSLAVANRTLSLPIWNFSCYHIFLPIATLNEVDTQFLLHVLSGKDKNIVISKSDFETRDMTHFLLTDNTTIRFNKFNIPEPQNALEVAVHKIDVVFVPLLAFDVLGNRVGYGKGFYDKFLAQCRPETLKIGLSFFEADEVIDDVFDDDIRLDYCVTPSRVYSF